MLSSHLYRRPARPSTVAPLPVQMTSASTHASLTSHNTIANYVTTYDDVTLGNNAQLGAVPEPPLPSYKIRRPQVKRSWIVVKYGCTGDDVGAYLDQNNLRKATGGRDHHKTYYECKSKSEFTNCGGAARITVDPVSKTAIIEEVEHDHSEAR